MSNRSANNTALSKYLTFYLNSVKYGINILKVREILSNTKTRITPMADCPSFICGVVNLRGSIIPIINLRSRLNMPSAEADFFNAIVIIEKAVNGQITQQGLLVDTVASVMNIEPDHIEKLDIPGSCTSQEYFLGIAHTEEYEVMLIDPDHLLSNKESVKVNDLAQAV